MKYRLPILWPGSESDPEDPNFHLVFRVPKSDTYQLCIANTKL